MQMSNVSYKYERVRPTLGQTESLEYAKSIQLLLGGSDEGALQFWLEQSIHSCLGQELSICSYPSDVYLYTDKDLSRKKGSIVTNMSADFISKGIPSRVDKTYLGLFSMTVDTIYLHRWRIGKSDNIFSV